MRFSIPVSLSDECCEINPTIRNAIRNQTHMTVATMCAGNAIENLWISLTLLDVSISPTLLHKMRQLLALHGSSHAYHKLLFKKSAEYMIRSHLLPFSPHDPDELALGGSQVHGSIAMRVLIVLEVVLAILLTHNLRRDYR